jgi:hypothetical protein
MRRTLFFTVPKALLVPKPNAEEQIIEKTKEVSRMIQNAQA